MSTQLPILPDRAYMLRAVTHSGDQLHEQFLFMNDFLNIDLEPGDRHPYRCRFHEQHSKRFSVHWLPGTPPQIDEVLGIDQTGCVQSFQNQPPVRLIPEGIRWDSWTISQGSVTQLSHKMILDYADFSQSRWYAVPQFHEAKQGSKGPEGGATKWLIKFVPVHEKIPQISVPVRIEVVNSD